MWYEAYITVTRMDYFKGKTVKCLQNYLKERGVTYSGLRKASLEQLCIQAKELGIEIDPDGLVENREEIISHKLQVPGEQVILENPSSLKSLSTNIGVLKNCMFNIFDIFTYQMETLEKDTESNSDPIKDIRKMEGNSLAKDGYVVELKFAQYEQSPSWYAVLGKVKPRETEKDLPSGKC